MEQQQQATQSLATAAIGWVSESRFKERTQYLEEMLALPQPDFLSMLPFSIGDKIMPTPVGTLINVFAQVKTDEGHHTVIREALLEFSENNPDLEVAGQIYGYYDHPDGKYRVEVQLNKQLDWTPVASVPQFVMTLVVEVKLGGAVVTGFMADRNEWVGMLLSAPKQEVVTEPKPVPDLSQIFLKRSSEPKPVALDKVVKNLPNLDLSTPVQMNKEAYSFAEGGIVQPFVASGTAGQAKREDGDGTMSLYAPSPERLEAMGQPADQRTVAEMIHDLLSRGHRMPTPFQELTANKLKAEVSDIEQVKFFLDEVFRAGNLWLYDQLATALKAEKHGSIDSRQTIFLLTITGNWQEHRGPIDAVVKMKAYWVSDKERSNELFRISGPMAL